MVDSTFIQSGETRAVKIIDVDVDNKRCQGRDLTGGVFYVDLNVSDSGLINIPSLGDEWIVQRRGTSWILKTQIGSPDLSSRSPGDKVISADNEIHLQSQNGVIIDGEDLLQNFGADATGRPNLILRSDFWGVYKTTDSGDVVLKNTSGTDNIIYWRAVRNGSKFSISSTSGIGNPKNSLLAQPASPDDYCEIKTKITKLDISDIHMLSSYFAGEMYHDDYLTKGTCCWNVYCTLDTSGNIATSASGSLVMASSGSDFTRVNGSAESPPTSATHFETHVLFSQGYIRQIMSGLTINPRHWKRTALGQETFSAFSGINIKAVNPSAPWKIIFGKNSDGYWFLDQTGIYKSTSAGVTKAAVGTGGISIKVDSTTYNTSETPPTGSVGFEGEFEFFGVYYPSASIYCDRLLCNLGSSLTAWHPAEIDVDGRYIRFQGNKIIMNDEVGIKASNVDGTKYVQINADDPNGMLETIHGGALLLEDEEGSTVIGAGMPTGPWATMFTTALPNSDFRHLDATTSAISHWVPTSASSYVDKYTSGSIQYHNYGGGGFIEGDYGQVNAVQAGYTIGDNYWDIFSTSSIYAGFESKYLLRIASNQRNFIIRTYANYVGALGTSGRVRVECDFYDGQQNFIQTMSLPSPYLSGFTSANAMWIAGRFYVPNDTCFIRPRILGKTGSTNAANKIRIQYIDLKPCIYTYPEITSFYVNYGTPDDSTSQVTMSSKGAGDTGWHKITTGTGTWAPYAYIFLNLTNPCKLVIWLNCAVYNNSSTIVNAKVKVENVNIADQWTKDIGVGVDGVTYNGIHMMDVVDVTAGGATTITPMFAFDSPYTGWIYVARYHLYVQVYGLDISSSNVIW